MYLHACQVRVTVGNSGLCCCTCVAYFEDSLRFRFVTKIQAPGIQFLRQKKKKKQKKKQPIMDIAYIRIFWFSKHAAKLHGTEWICCKDKDG